MSTPVHNIDSSEAGSELLPAGQFFGEVSNRDLGQGLVFSEIKHEGPKTLPKHHHELAFFALILRGRYHEIFVDGDAALVPLSVIFTHRGVDHRDEIAPCGMHIFSIELDGRWLERLNEHHLTPQRTLSAKGNELTWLATRLYREYTDCYARSRL